MGRFILRRAVHGVFVIIAVATALFFLLRLTGDPVVILLGPGASPEAIAQLDHALGLDQPLPVQYVTFLSDTARLQLGTSILAHTDVWTMIQRALPNTFLLTFSALAIGLLVAFPVGIYAALHRNSFGSLVAMMGAISGVSIPGFWLGILLILLFAVRLHWLPSFGTGSVLNWIMPALTLSVGIIARESRLVRAGMLDVLHQDYIRTARTKGLRERAILLRHAIKNAALPVVASLSNGLSHLIGGALVIEQVFAIPGMGQQMFQAVDNRDYPVVQGTVFVIAVWVVLVNLAVDVAYGYLDPRISTESLA